MALTLKAKPKQRRTLAAFLLCALSLTGCGSASLNLDTTTGSGSFSGASAGFGSSFFSGMLNGSF